LTWKLTDLETMKTDLKVLKFEYSLNFHLFCLDSNTSSLKIALETKSLYETFIPDFRY